LPPNLLDFYHADPFIRRLARKGASLTADDAVGHPSLPNYLEMFSGSTQGVTNDVVPSTLLTAPSLGGQLLASGLTFAGYSEDLPAVGFVGKQSGKYVRRHAPWTMFADVPPELNKPFSQFPSDFSQLPTVSFVIPNIKNDMHSASIRRADRWLKDNIKAYADWATTHNSLLVVTWDEGSGGNRIPTIFYGANVRHGDVALPSNHDRFLRTIEGMYDLPLLGGAVNHTPLRKEFTTSVTATSVQMRAQAHEVAPPASPFSANSIADSAWATLSAFMHDGDDVPTAI
jgi:acid phosphatase